MRRLSRTYTDYIKGPRWEAKRQKYFNTYGKWCKACGSWNNIKIHHMSYANFGHEPLSDLVSLCNPCHVAVHQLHRKVGGDLRVVTLNYIQTKALQRQRSKTPRR